MPSITWLGLLASVTLISLLLGILMSMVRAKYIHVEVRQGESYTYEVEEYGCVSLLATILGVLFFTIAATSFVVLLFKLVVIVLIPSLDTIISTVGITYAIILVLSLVFFVTLAILSFFKDLFNPPR